MDRARTRALPANISLGVGVVALGAATYVALTHGTHHEQARRTTPSPGALSLDATVVDSGLGAALSGRF